MQFGHKKIKKKTHEPQPIRIETNHNYQSNQVDRRWVSPNQRPDRWRPPQQSSRSTNPGDVKDWRRGGGCAVCVRWWGGGGGCGVCAKKEVEFWKMIYENFGRKPFIKILKGVFRSTENVFSLTSILQVNKHPQMLKMFYGKYFTAKQTKPKMKKKKKSRAFIFYF